MSIDKINVDGQSIRFTQGAGDLMSGNRYGDFSRISAYSGDGGLHTGSQSPTFGRHGQAFDVFEGFRNITDGKF